MTIAVGVLCQDGVVIGADSSATFSAGMEPTIEQKTEKINIIGGNVIVTGTGQGGLGQRFNYVVEKYMRDGHLKPDKPYQEVGREIAAFTIQNFASTQTRAGQFGGLMAFPLGNSFHLCEFATADLQPEFKTPDIWYVAMGSGQKIADPFLGLIRRVFWKDSRPTCQDGIFYVSWVLHQTIDLNAGGIDGPMKITILQNSADNSGFKARFITKDELDQHLENIDGLEKHIGQYKEIMQGKGAPPQTIPDLKDPAVSTIKS